MHVYLIQHAEAVSSDINLERPITERGARDTERLAIFARKHLGAGISRIYHSGKTRARQTAEIFAHHLDLDSALTQADALDPDSDPSVWAMRINELDENVMLVGHMPHIGRLASTLVTGDPNKQIVDIRNSAIMKLSKAGHGNWLVAEYVTPDSV
jgi:phosphohistidine phosphatase